MHGPRMRTTYIYVQNFLFNFKLSYLPSTSQKNEDFTRKCFDVIQKIKHSQFTPHVWRTLVFLHGSCKRDSQDYLHSFRTVLDCVQFKI
jgi:hypothetical protein